MAIWRKLLHENSPTADFPTLNQGTSGLAATATALATARTIGGTSFDGTANIAVGLSGTTTALATARTIGGTSFDGTANIAVGLAGTATTLATARAINGVNFDGSAAITVTAAGSTLSDAVGYSRGGTTLTGFTAGDILYASSTTALAKLAKGTANQVLAMNSGATAPQWSAATSGDVTGVTAGAGLSGGGGSGALTVTLDLTELADGTADLVPTTDKLVYLDDDVQKVMACEDVNLSAFDNDSSWTSYAEPGIFSGGGTPTLASGVTAGEIRTLIGAGTSSADGDITGVTIVTDSGSGSKMSDASGSADFSILGATGVGVTNSGNTATITAVAGEIGLTSLSGYTAAAYANASSVGASSIVTTGTISSGGWNATAIPVGKGGTGATAKTGTGSNVLSGSPSFTGTAAFPAQGVEIDGDLAITVESVIAVNRGGTGTTATTGSGNNVLSASPTFTGTALAANLTLSGNLSVSGTSTVVNSTVETVSITDAMIKLRAGAVSWTDAGIIFERGGAAVAGNGGVASTAARDAAMWYDAGTGHFSVGEVDAGLNEVDNVPDDISNYSNTANIHQIALCSVSTSAGSDKFAPIGSIHVDSDDDSGTPYIRVS